MRTVPLTSSPALQAASHRLSPSAFGMGTAAVADPMHFASAVARTMRSAGVRRILVVDDFAVFRAGVRRAMTVDDGPEWMEAATLAQAIDARGRERPDLVLLDLNLPDSRGLATLLAARRAFGDAPIVVIIGKGTSADDRQGLLMAGASGTLARGADERALAVALRAAVLDAGLHDPGAGGAGRPEGTSARARAALRTPSRSCS